MAAKYILAVVAAIFFVVAAMRVARDGALTAQTRAWFLIAAIFSLVSTWLWLRR